ncbi:response regulator transcription factor [Allocoleopsis franciscana]|uniref:Response regulator containing a CheY-like receiver domain and an HTH DNA-binding domain n=1 Tax=Allocoleopsis franciscana PCC 7113 TaxID=1173027 RepID=K9WGV5_9CYAN|nr:response regulator transcription factor [Allocoleopsis franciscana]AFZ19036.1 response regulator containing a CheY-like receiver domain and an HTH DNA-binding domain [Allocoleopsis franciscana PCC 7113]
MPLIILVADDNLGTRLSVSDYLEMSGYSVIVAEDGQEALSKIEKYHPHLLVTDINMPRMDGYELVKKLRQQPSFRLLPIVLLTERATTKERIEGYESGCDVYLPKPFEMDELGAVIRNLVERQLDRKVSFPDSRTTSERSPDWDSPSTPDNMPAEAIAPNSTAIELTEREKEVLVLLAIGLSNVEIGKKLYRSPRTVEKHVSSLLRKTETSNRAELIRFALKNHLVN